MSEEPENAPPQTAHEKLLALVEKRKAESGQANRRNIPGQRRAEAAAAHRSLSKSKPAMSK